MTTTQHLSATSPGWAPMWDALAEACGDYADCCPVTGECWQYMGTVDGRHEFRHRHRYEGRDIATYGRARGRVYLHLSAATGQVQFCRADQTTLPSTQRPVLRGNSYAFEPSDADPGL